MFRRILIPSLICALAALAADKPNFSGTWHLDESKSDVTHSHVTKKVQHSDSEITVNNITLKLDGKANANGVSAKLDGNTLVIRTKHEKLSVEERWSLSGDGKTLTIVSKASGGPAGANSISQQYVKE